MTRRSALLAPLAVSGCSWFDDLFNEKKTPLPGKREAIFADRRGLVVDENAPKVVLPPAVRNAAWPQAGGNPAHLMGHLAANDRLAEAWRAKVGDGGGYRQVLMAQPVVSGGTVFTMDSDAMVSAFTLTDGKRLWRVDSKPKDVDSTNVGGGLGVDGSTLYAVNGLLQLVALDVATGQQKWASDLGVPARSAPTTADGRVFVITIDDRLLAYSAADGRQLWSRDVSKLVSLGLLPGAGNQAYLTEPTRSRLLESVVALDQRGGDRWRFDGVSPYNSGMILTSGDALYYIWQASPTGDNPTDTTYVTHLRVTDGVALWQTPLPALNADPVAPLLA